MELIHQHLLISFPGTTYLVKAISHIDLTSCPSHWSPLTDTTVSTFIHSSRDSLLKYLLVLLMVSLLLNLPNTSYCIMQIMPLSSTVCCYLPTILRRRCCHPHFRRKGLTHEFLNERGNLTLPVVCFYNILFPTLLFLLHCFMIHPSKCPSLKLEHERLRNWDFLSFTFVSLVPTSE